MILGECDSCSGWVVNPTTVKCPYCEPRCYPLKALILREVPDGSRIDVQGSKLYGPDNKVIYDRQVTADPEEIARLRRLLHAYDEGNLPAGWVQGDIDREVIGKLTKGVREHGTLMWFSSSCRSDVPPTEKVKMEITTCGTDITAVRIDD